MERGRERPESRGERQRGSWKEAKTGRNRRIEVERGREIKRVAERGQREVRKRPERGQREAGERPERGQREAGDWWREADRGLERGGESRKEFERVLETKGLQRSIVGIYNIFVNVSNLCSHKPLLFTKCL